MSKTLEEKKESLLKELGYQNDKGMESHLGEHYRKGFDAGIKAYKEMLEGEYPESRSVYACRLILAEAKLQQQAEKIERLKLNIKKVYNGDLLDEDIHLEVFGE